MADDGPPLLKPVPRRPFNVNLTSATPPSDDSDHDERPQLDRAQFLLNPSDATPSMSRSPSSMNLTSSTLYGIYSPTTSGGQDADFDEGETPWGTGARTPVRRTSVDEATYELMVGRAHVNRRRSSHRTLDTTKPHSTPGRGPVANAISYGLRAMLLFALGVGYGVLLAKFQDGNAWTPSQSHNYKNLAFWGVAATVWGGMMPWLDSLWYDVFGEEASENEVAITVETDSNNGSDPATDWAIVMRAIGVFVGIMLAIRKVAWVSTLQVSLTLAMVNPLLWWLIDRSQVGFILSAAVGLVGWLIAMGVDPHMVPLPPSSHLALIRAGGLAPGGANQTVTAPANSAEAPFLLAHIASQETVETGIWMLSVLFCSCLCFGNIGRRLAWEPSAVGRGRWGGVR